MQKTPPPDLSSHLSAIRLPAPNSHKGQNGKLLIIGGSELFHAASRWSLDIASKFVDMVFYSSIPDNNQLIKEAKGKFWNGIVVGREVMEDYIEEADAILIGPGMERGGATQELVNKLLVKYPTKKWVIDAGALQMVDPSLLNDRCIITPHQRELDQVLHNYGGPLDQLVKSGVTILLKGQIDQVMFWTQDASKQVIEIEGGNPGMTKGGTGDVLSGLVAAFYCQTGAVDSAVVASYINKKAGEVLYQKVGTFFNASDLVEVIPQVTWSYIYDPHNVLTKDVH